MDETTAARSCLVGPNGQANNGSRSPAPLLAASRPPRKPPGRPYAYWGWQPTSYRPVAELYRSRFAIETSYRQLHQARLQTCVRSPPLRLLFVGIALVLRNVWVGVQDEFLAPRRQRARRYQLGRLRFRELLAWLSDLAEAGFGVRVGVAAEVPVRVPLPPPDSPGRLGNY